MQIENEKYFCTPSRMNKTMLYKYLDSDGGVKMLEDRTLQFTNATQLNDPFDCHPALIDFSKVPEQKNGNWPPEFIANHNFGKRGEYRNLSYICSLSKVHDSLLMWSYYNSHKGICIGLDMEKTRQYYSQMHGMLIGSCVEMEVQYMDVVKKPNYYQDPMDYFRYQMATKAKAWEHEQEVRLFSYEPDTNYMRLLPDQDSSKGPIDWKEVRAFLKIGRECFDSVYLGVNMTEKDKEKAIKIAQMCNPNINIYQMEIDPDAFRLREKKI